MKYSQDIIPIPNRLDLYFHSSIKIRFEFSHLRICLFQTGFSARFARFLNMSCLTTILCPTSYSSLRIRHKILRFGSSKLHRFKTVQHCTSHLSNRSQNSYSTFIVTILHLSLFLRHFVLSRFCQAAIVLFLVTYYKCYTTKIIAHHLSHQHGRFFRP